VDALLPIASGGTKAGVVSPIGCENMCAAVHSYIDQVATLDVLIDFAGGVPICECLCRWAIVLLVSFLSVFRTLAHRHHSSLRELTHYSICVLPPKESIDNPSCRDKQKMPLRPLPEYRKYKATFHGATFHGTPTGASQQPARAHPALPGARPRRPGPPEAPPPCKHRPAGGRVTGSWRGGAAAETGAPACGRAARFQRSAGWAGTAGGGSDAGCGPSQACGIGATSVPHQTQSGRGPGDGFLVDMRRSNRGWVDCALQMLEHLPDHLALGHGGDAPQHPTLTPQAVCHSPCKDALQQPCPAPARRPRVRRLRVHPWLARRGDDRPAQGAVQGQTSTIASQMDPRQGHERGQLVEQF